MVHGNPDYYRSAGMGFESKFNVLSAGGVNIAAGTSYTIFNKTGIGVIDAFSFTSSHDEFGFQFKLDGITYLSIGWSGSGSKTYITPERLNKMGGEDALFKNVQYAADQAPNAIILKRPIEFNKSFEIIRVNTAATNQDFAGLIAYRIEL